MLWQLILGRVAADCRCLLHGASELILASELKLNEHNGHASRFGGANSS